MKKLIIPVALVAILIGVGSAYQLSRLEEQPPETSLITNTQTEEAKTVSADLPDPAKKTPESPVNELLSTVNADMETEAVMADESDILPQDFANENTEINNLSEQIYDQNNF